MRKKTPKSALSNVEDCFTKRWLPVGIDMARRSVRWMDFGDNDASEPMFDVCVSRLRRILPPPREWDTDFHTLVATAGHLETTAPEGLIFHVSRCGSTLLANAIRADSSLVVMSEPGTILTLLSPQEYTLWDLLRRNNERIGTSERRRLVESVITLYCHRLLGHRARGVVIKFNDTGILSLPTVLRWWPNTRVLILIRNPLEVIVSSARGPTGWLRLASDAPDIAGRPFGWSGSRVKMMTKEERCARVVGRIQEVALACLSNRCRVADYADLTEPRISEIAEFLGASSALKQDAIRAAMSTYSKDATQSRTFSPDIDDKIVSASYAARAAAERWALGGYKALFEEAKLCWSR